jgi:hypothetical protein
VAVLVESLEQGRALRKHLPWPLFGLSAQEQQHLPAGPLTCTKTIITTLRANRQGVAADVVIRADGTGSPWQDTWGPEATADQQPALIIDIVDDFDSQAQQDAVSRHVHLGKSRGAR